ncbi:MAG: aldehyde dehydrogenase family protein [Planctomycetia bacterium]|nr:aldehyde dehydrogenase family protein [Planctomycetia bacterium]
MTRFSNECARARAAQAAWSQRPIRERLSPIREFRYRLVESAAALCSAAQADVKRSPDELVATDLVPTASAAKFLERRAASILAPRRVGDRPLWLWGCRDTVHRRPRGVVGLIGTWNYPVFLNAVPILHALAAGNAVLWKPSELAPRSAEILHELFLHAGFPPDLVQRLPATRDAGPALVESAIDFLHFTGSEPVGRAIARRLGERLIPSTLELSGCDAMFVLKDADLDLAAKLARYGSTLNHGQTCMAVRRVLVARPAFAAFLERLRSLLSPDRPDLAMPGEADRRDRLLTDARAAGCEVIEGNPTVIVNTKGERNLAANREALFAPLLTVTPFDSLDEALERDGETKLKLTASIITSDTEAARILAARLPVGCITINDVIVPTAHPGTPFGGRGASGWGSTQGMEGLLEMTVPQVITNRSGKFRPHAEPGGSGDVPRGYLRLVHGRGFRERWRGFRQLFAGLRAGRTN